jgi:glycosyltransferase involved in cell wall biosynthesis
MKISLITVCYNSDKTIRKTLESIIQQNYSNIEYIIIDGGSTDNTLKIIAEFNKKVNILISEPDKGLYDAMNKGIKLATGDIVGILNSDDIFVDNNVLENVSKFHQKNKVEASVGNIIQINRSGITVRKYSANNWNPDKLRIGFMPPHPSVFFRRELFDKYGYYNINFISGADYELIVRFFLKHQISWKFSNITTTSMLIGGISSSGYKSYKLISREIKKALELNNIKFSYLIVLSRVIWKLNGIFKKK